MEISEETSSSAAATCDNDGACSPMQHSRTWGVNDMSRR